MEVQEIQARETKTKLWLLIVSLLTIAALSVAALQENFASDWYQLRQQYAEILEAEADDELGRIAAEKFEVRIVQNFLPAVGRADRCVTCHAGLDDPRMVDQDQPFSSHPGRYLELHDPEKFGCTVCHDGQGRATSVEDAHGFSAHWEEPMRDRAYVRSSCTRCHSEAAVFGSDALFAQADGGDAELSARSAILLRGRELSSELGCRGCHKLEGKGGELGPDLTGVGTKAAHGFSFLHLHHPEGSQKRVEDWLVEHFLHPASISPGSIMPAVDSSDDAIALTAYMLSLGNKVPGLMAQSPSVALPEPQGAELYASYCSSCHGADGKGGNVEGLLTPSLGSLDVLAVASDDFYRLTIEQGRRGTQMPAWGSEHGNLSRKEIDQIVGHLRSWMPDGPRLEDVGSRFGDVKAGANLYRGMCAGCHGLQGEGGVGVSLDSANFLSIADDAFLARAILHGRSGTAMPSWRQLDSQSVSDLLAFVRAWQKKAPSYEAVQSARMSVETGVNQEIGAVLYAGSCASCHGDDRRGGIGPSLFSPDFLGAIDDRYLYRAIVEGRPSTAMPAWTHLSADDVGALIDFLRESTPAQSVVSLQPYERGHAGAGEVYYKQACQSCHGEAGLGGVGPQLANPVFLSSVSDQALAHWIGHGRAGTSMEGFLESEQGPLQLRPAQIADVIAYLRQLGATRSSVVMRDVVGLPSLGEDLYLGNCASCHGLNGEGASGPQLNNPEFLRAASNGFLQATIVLGRGGTAMQPMVRGHGVEGLGQIPPENVTDIVAFLRGWDRPQSWLRARKISEVSDAAIEEGRRSYGEYCASCHGHDGRGKYDQDGYAPALNNQQFLEATTDGVLLATIARGRSGTPMLGFGHGAQGIVSLDGTEIANIVAFIRDWQRENSSNGGGKP